MTVADVRVAVRTSGPRALRRPAAVAAAALAASAYVTLVDPNATGHYPTCPFLAVTGLYCPGCGALRTMHALGHGDIGAALGLNVLAVLGFVLLGVIWLRWARREWRGVPRTTMAPAWSIRLLVVAVVAFWVLRNLPIGSALAP